MKRGKKCIALVTALVLVLSMLTACGSSPVQPPVDTTAQEQIVLDTINLFFVKSGMSTKSNTQRAAAASALAAVQDGTITLEQSVVGSSAGIVTAVFTLPLAKELKKVAGVDLLQTPAEAESGRIAAAPVTEAYLQALYNGVDAALNGNSGTISQNTLDKIFTYIKLVNVVGCEVGVAVETIGGRQYMAISLQSGALRVDALRNKLVEEVRKLNSKQ